MDHLDYALRLDDDSHFLEPINYDIFKLMEDGGYLYGYLKAKPGNPDCIYGLWNLINNYIHTQNITPTFFNKLGNNRHFLNNFEASKISVWKSNAYRNYIDVIDRAKGIFLHRWGDAPIKTWGISLFVPMDKIHYFSDINYFHRGHQVIRNKFTI